MTIGILLFFMEMLEISIMIMAYDLMLVLVMFMLIMMFIFLEVILEETTLSLEKTTIFITIKQDQMRILGSEALF